MKVKALIEELKKHDPDKQIVIRGYEDGYNDILKIYEINIFPNPGQKNWYCGEYEQAYEEKEIKISTPAIELYGDNTKREES